MVKITRSKSGLARMAWLGMLTSVCFLSALVLNFFPDQTALAGSFSSPAPVGGGSQLIYDLSIKVRPTDGLAFIAGSKSKVFIANTSNLAALYDINDSGSLNGTQWPSLTFGNDGRGYVAWRTNTSGWRGYMRVIPAGWNGGGLPAGFSLSDRISQATGLEMDQPSLAYSSKSNKLYVVGYFVTSGDATLGIVESSDGGNTFGNYKALINDPSRSNMTPEVCVDANDNIHVLSRINSQLDSISRINGVWDSSYTSLAPNGWDPRAADGRDTKQIVCAPDGTVYAVWKNNGDRSGSFGVSRRLPGQGWTTITTNLRPGANLSRVNASISPDGTLWVVMSSEAGYIGTWVVTSADKGASFSSPIAVYSRDTTANPGVAIDATGIGSKIHVATSFNGNIPESTFYSYADYTGPGSLPPSQPVPPSNPGDPGTDPTNPGTPPTNPGTPTDPTAFLPPSSVSAVGVSSSKVNLTWKDKSNGELDFRIERRTSGDGWAEVGTSAANSTAYTDGSMNMNTTYAYRIRARSNSGYTAYSSEASATTLAPTSLQFGTQPGSGEAGKPLGQQPSVNVLDQNGGLVKNYNGQITLSLANNPGGAAISGDVATVTNGVAQFSAVQLDKGGSGFTLNASPASGSPAVTNGLTTSTGFNISGNTTPVPPVDLGQDQRNAPIGLNQFQQLWERSDKAIVDGQVSRSWTWGPSITGLVTEPYAEGNTRQVQYFDKTRMEQTQGRAVTNGLLAKELITGLMQLGDNSFKQYPANDKIKIAGDQGTNQNPTYASFRKVSTIDQENRVEERGGQVISATLNKDGSTGTEAGLGAKYNVKNVYYDKTLQHNIPDTFWKFMNQTGSIYVNGIYIQGPVVDWLSTMGLPLSEAYWTRSVVGGLEQDVMVQIFERRVLTFTPANSQSFQVEMGNVGQHYREWRKAVLTAPLIPASTGNR